MSLIKIIIFLLLLVPRPAGADDDPEFVNARLGEVYNILNNSSLRAPDLSDYVLSYTEVFGFGRDDLGRELATEVWNLLIAAVKLDEIINHLGLENDFPENYLRRYALSYNEHVFEPFSRGEYQVRRASFWERISGSPEIIIDIPGGDEEYYRILGGFNTVILYERLYVGAFLHTLANNLVNIQHHSGRHLTVLLAWVRSHWPGMVLETENGRRDLGISPIVSLFKDFRGEDIEFFWRDPMRSAGAPHLMFPLEEDWDYGADSQGSLGGSRFFEAEPTTMEEIHLGPFCLIAENFDSGERRTIQFDMPPFTFAEIHAVPSGYDSLSRRQGPPSFAGRFVSKLPNTDPGGWIGYQIYDGSSGALVDLGYYEQRAIYPFLQVEIVENGTCGERHVISPQTGVEEMARQTIPGELLKPKPESKKKRMGKGEKAPKPIPELKRAKSSEKIDLKRVDDAFFENLKQVEPKKATK